MKLSMLSADIEQLRKLYGLLLGIESLLLRLFVLDDIRADVLCFGFAGR
jgi:hypothetical protein